MNKNEIWSWKWKHSVDVHISNILETDDRFFKIAMFNRSPNIRKIKFSDVEFISKLSTPEDGSKLGLDSRWLSGTLNNQSSLQDIKEDVCEHLWDIDGDKLQCEFCGKIKDDI